MRKSAALFFVFFFKNASLCKEKKKKKKKKTHIFQLISFCFKTRDFQINKGAFFFFFETMDYDLS
jgi:hypothetical protein